ncbi:MerR family transcriptional regulator [soil metagenome]|jgi:DNA-binding transcriptional MerR regulator
MRERLTIGEVARLTGVTTKTVRHYHKIGLLPDPDRSEGGYRLYEADDLLRLQRIRRLRSFGLSLKQIKSVLSDPDEGSTLRKVLEALLEEVSGEIERLEERRSRIEELLALEEIEVSVEVSGKPYAIELAEKHLGERLSEVSAGLWEQERKLWATLEAFEWPEGYKEMQESITLYYAERPAEYREMLEISERLYAIADLPEDSLEVRELARDLARRLERTPFPDDPLEGSPLASGPLGNVFSEVLLGNFSPAQKRVMELVQQTFDEKIGP